VQGNPVPVSLVHKRDWNGFDEAKFEREPTATEVCTPVCDEEVGEVAVEDAKEEVL